MLAPFVAHAAHAVFSAGTESSEHRTLVHATVTARKTPLMTDVIIHEVELEAHIASLGVLMQTAMGHYEAHGCFSDRGEADKWLCAMEEAIGARSPATIRRLEQSRGLA